MTSGSAEPLIAYPAAPAALGGHRLLASGPDVRLRTRARALAGMQKEALVEVGPTGALWRLLCDEGPWLNGTDLAPFPLGYFAAGLAASLLSDILAEAGVRNVPLGAPGLRVDLFFTMQGSLLKGTMAAGVDGVRLTVDVDHRTNPSDTDVVVAAALANRSVVSRALSSRLPSRFFLRVNGEPAAAGPDAETLADDVADDVPDPGPVFIDAHPAADSDRSQPIVRKVTDATGAGTHETRGMQGAVGLQPDQKRTVHVRADASLRADGLKETAVECIQPGGSRFVLLSDEAPVAGGAGRAPCGLTYLSAGIAFCFMTQLGRYAQVRKLELRDYRIVQDTGFRRAGSGGPQASPATTLVWLDSEDSAEKNSRMVQMGERTCYLHTTFRESVELAFTIHRRAGAWPSTP